MQSYDPFFRSLMISDTHLKCEDDDGPIEYKLKLDNRTPIGLKKLASQLNWRLDEGQHQFGKRQAHYVLGITDDGTPGRQSEQELAQTYAVLESVATNIGVTIVEDYRYTIQDSHIAHLVVCKMEKHKLNELNVGFVGPSQHGKTTTIAHLAFGQLDTDGKLRNLILRHEHEKQSGLTSSIKKELIGFKGNQLINYTSGIDTTWADIAKSSDTIINLIDFPGAKKYIKTTLFGLSAYSLDAIIIIFDSHSPFPQLPQLPQLPQPENNIYITLATIANIPYTIIPTKGDLTNDKSILSNITGEGMDQLKSFLSSIKKIQPQSSLPHFNILETYHIPDVGTILSGTLHGGTLKFNQDVYLCNGITTIPTKIKYIKKKQMDSQFLFSGESGSIELSSMDAQMDKNMIITLTPPISHSDFTFHIIKNMGHKIEKQGLLFVSNQTTSVTIVHEDNTLTIHTHLPIITSFLEGAVTILKGDIMLVVGTLSNF